MRLRLRRRSLLAGIAAVFALGAALFVVVRADFSTEAGPQWQEDGLQGVLVHALAPGHRDAGLLFAGTHGGVYRRTDGEWQLVLPAGDAWGVTLLSDDRTVLVAENDGTVAVSRDGGNRWRRSMVSSDGAYAVTAQPRAPNWLLAGASGGIYLSRDGGAHWQRRLATPGSAGDTFSWAPGGPRTVFAGVVAGSPGGRTSVYVSRNAGLTWQVYGRGLQSWSGVMAVAAAPDGTVLAGTMGNTLWTAPAANPQWHKTRGIVPATNNHVAAIAAVPGKPRTFFASTLGYGVFQTTNVGRSWRDISGNLPADQSVRTVLSLAYAARRGTLYAGTANGIYALPIEGSPRRS